MQDKALQSEKMQDNPSKSRIVGNSAVSRCLLFQTTFSFRLFILFALSFSRPILSLSLLCSSETSEALFA